MEMMNSHITDYLMRRTRRLLVFAKEVQMFIRACEHPLGVYGAIA